MILYEIYFFRRRWFPAHHRDRLVLNTIYSRGHSFPRNRVILRLQIIPRICSTGPICICVLLSLLTRFSCCVSQKLFGNFVRYNIVFWSFSIVFACYGIRFRSLWFGQFSMFLISYGHLAFDYDRYGQRDRESDHTGNGFWGDSWGVPTLLEGVILYCVD